MTYDTVWPLQDLFRDELNRKLRVGVIGFGRIRARFVSVMQQNEMLDIAYICDAHPAARELAARPFLRRKSWLMRMPFSPIARYE